MACFLVPVTEAIIITAVTRAVKSREPNAAVPKSGAEAGKTDVRISFSRKLRWLNSLLWGGSLLLAFEHVWHGEVVPWFPFLTAASDPNDAAAMLHEMATVGVSMAVLVTAVWVGMVLISDAMAKKAFMKSAAVKAGDRS